MTKMTKKDWYEVLKVIVTESGDERINDIMAFIDHEIELLDKKSSKSTLTKTQKENIAVIATIKDVLAEIGEPVTVSALLENESVATYTLEDGRKISNQKLSAILKKMVDSGEVVKTYEKKKAFFSLA
jgi:hypothetical protein